MRYASNASFLFALLLVGASSSGLAQTEGVGDLDGVWEGSLSYEMSSSGPTEQTRYVRLTVKNEKVDAYETRSSDGTRWFDQEAGLKRFRFTREEATISGVSLKTGRDNDGLWVEHQSMVLSKKNADTMNVYLLRVVNNVDLPRDHKDSLWSYLLVGELRRGS